MQRSTPTFLPNLQPASVRESTTPVSDTNGLASGLPIFVQGTLIAALALLPWWVWLAPGVSIDFSKIVLLVVGCAIGVIGLAFLALRTKRVTSTVPLPLVTWWGLVLLATCSALLSSSASSGLTGQLFEVHTVSFLAIAGVMMSLMLVFQTSTTMTRWLYIVLGVSYSSLLGWQLLRALTNWQWLSFGMFSEPVRSPLGSFNDVAIMAGVVCVVVLVYLLGTARKLISDILALITLVSALCILIIAHFTALWLLVGFFGLLLLLYLLSRDTVFASSDGTPPIDRPYISLVATVLVCVVAGSYIVFGDAWQGPVARLTGISYLEIRPSPTATLSIAQAVYQERAFLGIGPNHFDAAWRLHKDPSIMTTQFWGTDFAAGSGYIPTWFITTGLFGGIILFGFFGLWIRLGYRTFLVPTATHSMWYRYGLLSFSAATFLWIITFLYTPGVFIITLAAAATGLTFAATAALRPNDRITVPLAVDRRSGFVVMAAVLITLLGTMSGLRYVLTEFSAHRAFAAIQVAPLTSLADAAAALEEQLLRYEYEPAIVTAAQVQLFILNQLINQPEPTESDRRQFEAAAVRAVQLIEQAVARNDQNPTYHALRGAVYAILARAGIPDAATQVTSSLDRAEALDPRNPQYALLRAQLALQTGEVELARTHILTALTRKSNYSEALLLLAQIEIESGNTANALAAAQALVSIEPNNPTRHFQLGILLAATEESRAAVQALTTAITLDPNYANARYIRALILSNVGEQALALADLEVVASSNPENQAVSQLIADITAGNTDQIPSIRSVIPLSDQRQTSVENNVVVNELPDSMVLSPVNSLPPESSSQAATSTQSTPVEFDEVSPEEPSPTPL